MAWSIGGNFSPDVWDDIRENLYRKGPEFCANALANCDYENARRWKSWYGTRGRLRNEKWFRKGQKWHAGRKGYYLQFCSLDALVEACIEKIQENDTCDNGGRWFWIDREGASKVETTLAERAA